MTRSFCVCLCLVGVLLGGCSTSYDSDWDTRDQVQLTELPDGGRQLVIRDAVERVHEPQDTPERCWAAAALMVRKAEVLGQEDALLPTLDQIEAQHQFDLEAVIGAEAVEALSVAMELSGDASFRPNDAAAWMELRDALAPEYLQRMNSRIVVVAEELLGPKLEPEQLVESIERGEPVLVGLEEQALMGHVWVMVGIEVDGEGRPVRVTLLDPRDGAPNNEDFDPKLHEMAFVEFESQLEFSLNRSSSVAALKSDVAWLGRHAESSDPAVYARLFRSDLRTAGWNIAAREWAIRQEKPIYSVTLTGTAAEALQQFVNLRLTERLQVYPYRFR